MNMRLDAKDQFDCELAKTGIYQLIMYQAKAYVFINCRAGMLSFHQV